MSSLTYRPNTTGDKDLAELEQKAEKFLQKIKKKKNSQQARMDLAACGAGTGMACGAVATASTSGAATVPCVGASCLAGATGAVLGANSPEIVKGISNLNVSPSAALETLHPPLSPVMRRGGKKTRNKRKRKRGRRTKRRRKKRKTRRKRKNLKKRTKSKKINKYLSRNDF